LSKPLVIQIFGHNLLWLYRRIKSFAYSNPFRAHLIRYERYLAQIEYPTHHLALQLY